MPYRILASLLCLIAAPALAWQCFNLARDNSMFQGPVALFLGPAVIGAIVGGIFGVFAKPFWIGFLCGFAGGLAGACTMWGIMWAGG